MSGFGAGSVSALDFDFTSFPNDDGTGLCTGKGIVPEPTESQISAFFSAIAKIAETEGIASEDGAAPTLPEDMGAASFAAVRGALSSLCGTSPTAAEIAELPPRILGAFTGWILGELTGPKG